MHINHDYFILVCVLDLPAYDRIHNITGQSKHHRSNRS